MSILTRTKKIARYVLLERTTGYLFYVTFLWSGYADTNRTRSATCSDGNAQNVNVPRPALYLSGSFTGFYVVDGPEQLY